MEQDLATPIIRPGLRKHKAEKYIPLHVGENLDSPRSAGKPQASRSYRPDLGAFLYERFLNQVIASI